MLIVDNDRCAFALGRYQEELAQVTQVGCVIADPPYGDRVHSGHDKNAADKRVDGGARSRPLSYAPWGPAEIREFVEIWSPRATGWMAVHSCSDLSPIWRAEFERAGRLAFAPVPCVIWAGNVRQQGDGPSSWTTWLNVARPRSREFMGGWTRQGAYVGPKSTEPGHIGGKPLWMMAAIVRDYSRPGELVVDPTAGYGTCGVAALGLGHSFVGCELDPETAAMADASLSRADHEARVAEALELMMATNKKRGLPVEQQEER